jgi:hypothetical protein
MRVLAFVLGLLGSLGAVLGIAFLFVACMGALAQQDETMRVVASSNIPVMSNEATRLLTTYGPWEKVPPGELQAYQERSLQLVHPVAQRQAELTEPFVPRLYLGMGFALLGLVGTGVAVGRSGWGARIILGALVGILLSAAWITTMAASVPQLAFGFLFLVPSILLSGMSAYVSLRIQRRTVLQRSSPRGRASSRMTRPH